MSYPSFDNYNGYRIQSPNRPPIINSNYAPPKSYLKDFQELKFKEILQFHRVELLNDEFSTLIAKENGKLLSVNKYPDDIFLTGFCFWFDNNFKLKGKSKESLVTFFNKLRKEPIVLKFANDLSEKVARIQFDDRYLKSMTQIFDYNISPENFHQEFYNSISKSSGSYMQNIFSTYMRVCCFYVLQKIKDCYLLKDKLIIQECIKNFDNYVKYIGDFKCKSFYSDEYKIILNLICEAIGISVRLITLNKSQRVFMKESFPTNINKTFDLYKHILKLKFIIVYQEENSFVYRAYRSDAEKIKYCLECKSSFEKKLKSNLKNVCFDCMMANYCSMNKERLENEDFFENSCKHRYCKNCLIYLYNSIQNKTNINCCSSDCKSQLLFTQIETFLKNKKNIGSKNGDLADFQCPKCQKNAIISKNQINNYVFCCKVCNQSSCLFHKCLIEKCYCFCPICKSRYNNSFQEVGDFAHIELLECLECRTIICKTCKSNMKNYDDYCNCKCYLCFNLKLSEQDNEGRCRNCHNICNICLLSFKEIQLHNCKKCHKSICRVCLNSIALGEKYQYFSKKNFCIFCENTKKK